MLEQQEQEKQFSKEGMTETEVFQKIVFGFIDSIPEKGPLYKKSEKGEMTTRTINFGQLFNSLVAISDGAINLSKSQKEAIMKRIGALKEEAFFWTQKQSSDEKRDFEDEVEKMAQLIWRR